MDEGISVAVVEDESNVQTSSNTAVDYYVDDDEKNVVNEIVVETSDIHNNSTNTMDAGLSQQQLEQQQQERHSPGDILRISRISLTGTGGSSVSSSSSMKLMCNRYSSPSSTSKMSNKSSPSSTERIRQQILSQSAPRSSSSSPHAKVVHRNARHHQQHEEEQEQEQMNEQKHALPGERLYFQAMNAKAQKERKWKLKTIETKKQAEIKVSPKTRVLASAFWTKKLRELAERFPGFDPELDSISFEELIECFDRLGLAVKTGVSSEATVENLKQECRHQLVQEPQQQQQQQGEGEERIDLKRVEELIRVCLDTTNAVDEQQFFSRSLIESFKALFTCPVKKPIDLRFEDKFHSIQEPKVISAREFVLHLEEEMRESQRRRHLTLETVQKEMERDLTFQPKITKIASNKKAPPLKSGTRSEEKQVHLRLYKEAERRKKRLEESMEKQSKQDLNKMLLECSFQPSINDFEQSIFMLQSLNDQSILDSPDECVQDHLNRMERARLEREEKEERLRQLGSLKSTSNNRRNRTVSARLFSTKSRLETSTNKPSNPPLAILDVIVAENMRVSIELFAGDDPEAIADEFAAVYHLGSIERDAVSDAIHSAIQTEEEHLRNHSQQQQQQLEANDEISFQHADEGDSSLLNVNNDKDQNDD